MNAISTDSSPQSSHPEPIAVDASRRSEERYRALIEATNQVVWSWSPDGTTTDFEQSRQWWLDLTGQSVAEQEASTESWLAVVHPEDRNSAAKSWSAATSHGTRYDIDYRVRDRRGGWLDARDQALGSQRKRDSGTVFSSPGNEPMYCASTFSSLWLNGAAMPPITALPRPTSVLLRT